MAKRRGIVARALDGRLDRTVLSDVGVLIGIGLFGFGLWQLSHPAAWLFAGVALAAVSVLAVLPQKKSDPKGVK
jgi:hypothetical protein